MQKRNDIMSVDAMMDERFGKVGTPEREAFRKEAYAYCVGQIISDARKREKITQQELAQRIGSNATGISPTYRFQQIVYLTCRKRKRRTWSWNVPQNSWCAWLEI